VDVLRVQDVRELPAYGAIIIGSAARMGKSLPEAVKFAQRNREALAQVPTAYFTVGTTMRSDTPDNRVKAKATLEPLCQIKEPVSLGLFAGKVDHSRLEQPWRFMVSFDKAGEMREGDWRDWDAIRAWAGELVGPLT
jgi:menaquinone-dependent protoporphyrinogen oxidase